MKLFWIITYGADGFGEVSGPFPDLHSALSLRRSNDDRIVSVDVADWTPQLAPLEEDEHD